MNKLTKRLIVVFLGEIAAVNSMEVDFSGDIYEPSQIKQKVDEGKLEEERLHKGNKININGKTYRLYVSQELQEGVKKDHRLINALSAAIDNVQKEQDIDEKVMGFNFVLFKGKIYTEAFLGENAK
ncbi:hypothetical protein [Candidatus Odyssella thessalonicensis]|uniref:hypothetical protein n=1 Tax=Candidatus Odyssella thessalonicensis TaxID=84647 RepID=UPI000225AC76|nr:hypothetical protein [Candidatus Odyssella thessalonicensis]